FDADLVVAAGADDRLADAETVDASLDGVARAVQDIFIEFLTGGRLRLKENLDAALQVESLVDGDAPLDAGEVGGLTGEIDPDRDGGHDDDEDEHVPGTKSHASRS